MAHPRLLLLIGALLISPLGGVSHANAASKAPVIKPKVFNSTDDIDIKLIDPRTKKSINPLITKFWVNSNRLNYELYSNNKEFDNYWESFHLIDYWTSLLTKGYIVEAASTPTNKSPKAMWLTVSIPGNDFTTISPKATGCEELGSTLRFRAALFTCVAVGEYHQYDDGVIFGSDHGDGVLGDGYIANIDAPGRECNAVDSTSSFYGATLKCVLLNGLRYPQTAPAVTIMNSKDNKEIYCMVDRTLAKQKQPLFGFKENVLITASCAKYFGNKSAKY